MHNYRYPEVPRPQASAQDVKLVGHHVQLVRVRKRPGVLQVLVGAACAVFHDDPRLIDGSDKRPRHNLRFPRATDDDRAHAPPRQPGRGGKATFQDRPGFPIIHAGAKHDDATVRHGGNPTARRGKIGRMEGTLVVVGSINADLVTHVERHPEPGETLLGRGDDIKAGGKGANQAVAAALQGAHVEFVGAVGADHYQVPAVKNLHEAGVDMSAVAEIDDELTGLAVITVDATGENTIIVVPGANARVDASYVARHSDRIATAGIVLLQGEIPRDGFKEAVAAARGRVIVNLAPVIEVDRASLLQADPLIVNEHEASLILEQLGGEHKTDPRELITALTDIGFASVVLTLGASGALVADKEITDIPTPKVEAIDTVGAGDAFAGALCAKLLAEPELSLADAALHAARVGAFSVTRPGAQDSYPGPGDLLPG